LQDRIFRPEEIAAIRLAYEEALRALKPAGCSEVRQEIVGKKIVEIAQRGERNPARIRALAFKELGVPLLLSASETSDLNQGADNRSSDVIVVDWKAITTAPFDRDLKLAVLDCDGAHALVFPCRRILNGWINSETDRQIDVRPTHWRDWRGVI
jgi:hypothetical protein